MSPVIILGLVLMWACVLVPMWLRRHDEVQEERSVDRFSTAMHTLSRREARADERYVVMPHRTRSMDVHVSGAAVPDDLEEQPRRSPRPARPPRRPLPARLLGAVVILVMAALGLLRRATLVVIGAVAGSFAATVGRIRSRERRPMTATTRRRRTLFGLLVATVVTLVLAVIVGGVMLWLLQGAVDIALVAFVRHLRQRALRAAAVARQRRRAAAAPVIVPLPAPEPIADAEPAVDSSEPEPFVAVDESPVGSADAQPDAEPEPPLPLPLTAEGSAGSWEPVPVPRPTYTMKPAAPARPPRTAEYADYSEPIVPVDEDRDDLDDTADLGEILEQRWAVND